MKILIQLLWCDLRFCISYQLSGDTTAAGPWTTLGVARGQKQIIYRECSKEFTRELMKQIPGPTPRDSDLTGLGWGLKIPFPSQAPT